MKKSLIEEGFYRDTHSKANDKLNPEKGEYSFVPSSGYKSVPEFDKTRKFNTKGSIYGYNNIKKGIKTAISRLEDIWFNIEKLLYRGDTTNREDVKNVKSFWSKYVREFNSLMKKMKKTGDLEISDEKKMGHGHVNIGGDLRDFRSWFNDYNPYFGVWVEKSMKKGDSNGGQTWGEVLNWNPENYDIDTIIGDSYNCSYVYRITPAKYCGVLKENVKDIIIKIKSPKRLNRKQIFEKAQKYIKKNYGLFVESIDVEASGEVDGGFMKTIRHIVNITFPVYEVYNRKIENGEEMNGVEVKSFIDNILSDDISDMIGSDEDMTTRIKGRLKDLEKRAGKVYRIYKDGVAIDTFVKKVCDNVSDSSVDFFKGGSVQETLKALQNASMEVEVKFISCEKDYCLALVVEK